MGRVEEGEGVDEWREGWVRIGICSIKLSGDAPDRYCLCKRMKGRFNLVCGDHASKHVCQ